jgi:hypothetical protein
LGSKNRPPWRSIGAFTVNNLEKQMLTFQIKQQIKARNREINSNKPQNTRKHSTTDQRVQNALEFSNPKVKRS